MDDRMVPLDDSWISTDADWLVIKAEDMAQLGDAYDPGNCPNQCGSDVVQTGPQDWVTGVWPVRCPGCGWEDY